MSRLWQRPDGDVAARQSRELRGAESLKAGTSPGHWRAQFHLHQVRAAVSVQGEFRAKVIKARIQVLEDVSKGLSIAPLLEAGEFSTVSESLTEADIEIREGRFADYMGKLVDKIPGGLKTGAKNFLVTKDTQLFKVMNRSVQYGDFVAKAVLYDHLMKKGETAEEALHVISEEFVPYNRLAGRGRDFLESHGALWFYNYKLRAVKIALRTARERPVTALLMAAGVEPAFGIDTPLTSALPGVFLEGKLGWSIGPQMGFNASKLGGVRQIWGSGGLQPKVAALGVLRFQELEFQKSSAKWCQAAVSRRFSRRRPDFAT